MKRAIFLDRDGTIVEDVDNLRTTLNLRILPGAARAILKLKKHGFLVIVITNQPVIARGWLSENGLLKIHELFMNRLKKHGAILDAIFFCPHHPRANIKKYRKRCLCRKPGTQLIKDALDRFRIDPQKSFFIGDSTCDILAGQRAGLKTILVLTGKGGTDGKYSIRPDFTAKNLREAAMLILSQ